MQNSGTVLFVGDDLCARTAVLESVGYRVLRCECNATAVVDALARDRVDAVLFHCDPISPSHLIIMAARTVTHAPLVLFANSSASYNDDDYDVTVPSLCSPSEWLVPITEAIEAHQNPGRRKSCKTVAIDEARKDQRYKSTR